MPAPQYSGTDEPRWSWINENSRARKAKGMNTSWGVGRHVDTAGGEADAEHGKARSRSVADGAEEDSRR